MQTNNKTSEGGENEAKQDDARYVGSCCEALSQTGGRPIAYLK